MANQPGTSPTVKTALNNMASASQNLSQALANGATNQQAQQAGQAFARSAGQVLTACT